MINIKNKKDCCGCNACVQICSHKCITMYDDEEGFQYPKVDATKCLKCGLCERVCPVINQSNARKPLESFAAINPNEEVRLKSSSGGIFSLLAENVIAEGGVVFGAKFNEKWEVVHGYAETLGDISQFRGSKYVQSYIGDNYIKAKQFLDIGRKVLFSGTPCQIAGLKLFLRKNYPNLLAVDIICHGVPSPMVWKRHITTSTFKGCKISNINFRDKSNGWEAFNFHISAKTKFGNQISIKNVIFNQDGYMRSFLSDLSLRPSCYCCPSRKGKGNSDITIADLWNWDNNPKLQYYNDDKGTSFILTYTSKGVYSLNNCNCQKRPIDINDAIKHNPNLIIDVKIPKDRSLFFKIAKFHPCDYALFCIQQKYAPSTFRLIAYNCKEFLKKTFKLK